MTPEKKKRRLRNLALLSLLLLAVGGTFAFQAFNQRAINDRLNEVDINVGGRVHDYYNRDTENKDVFVENYGERPIMARIRLSEFLETRQRDETDFTPLVAGTSRDDVENWTTWIPSAGNINDRENSNASNAFDQYATLIFGWERSGQDAPWYMPTFNHDNLDLRTAAAGHARDWIEGNGATDGVTDGATHPGDGIDAYWSANENFDNSGPIWPGEEVTNQTAQNLQQDRAPMTMNQWSNLPNEDKIGNFWVVDHNTGWAYWANRLDSEQASSYLLDAAEMTAAIEDKVFNGFYYYGIHVESGLVHPDQHEEFLNDGEQHHAELEEFLRGIQNGVMYDDGPNPLPNEDSAPAAFDFSTMRPGRIFTMAGEEYRYLENQGSGNHMIIRNDAIRNVSWNAQGTVLVDWYDALDSSVQDIVQPVANNFTTGEVEDASVTFTGGYRWIPNNLGGDVAADITQVVPGGTARAFALSLADVTRLSGGGLAFPNHTQRVFSVHGRAWWWLRTPATDTAAWRLTAAGGNLHGEGPRTFSLYNGGVRPALIIHQPSN
ncbi:DUF6273 domain-containing protein [Lactococcus ileimucosae]|uniref:DUF6273 domain-containing protein n=1 Tax=Lactococcus ileimucosae TaxID=2941329 RepID=UPI002042E0D2|nr:DUF6273 domain-containing protein [Lactococcus ileimucosae]